METPLSWDTLLGEIWLQHVFPFIGPDQYLFVGGVNRFFRSAYTSLYPHRTTDFAEVFTVAQAVLSYDEVRSLDHKTVLDTKILARKPRNGDISNSCNGCEKKVAHGMK
jgi:hypothetical protein